MKDIDVIKEKFRRCISFVLAILILLDLFIPTSILAKGNSMSLINNTRETILNSNDKNKPPLRANGIIEDRVFEDKTSPNKNQPPENESLQITKLEDNSEDNSKNYEKQDKKSNSILNSKKDSKKSFAKPQEEVKEEKLINNHEKPAYISWRIINPGVKIVNSDGEILFKDLKIEVVDLSDKELILNYSDLLRDENIKVKNFKEGLILSSPGLDDLKIIIENESNFNSDDNTKDIKDTKEFEANRPRGLTPKEEEIGLKLLENEYIEDEGLFARAFRSLRASHPLDNKKFTINTLLDATTSTGPIQINQFFTINLDEKLTVKDESNLSPIKYKGEIVARPTYLKNENKIKYTVVKEIPENSKIRIAVDVDYNTDKIDPDDKKHSIKNNITGFGVEGTINLPETIVDNEGNVINTLLEPDGNGTGQIFDAGKKYTVNMDAYGDPVIDEMELKAINWTVKFSSTDDLKDLGLKLNITTVKGSGLGQIENVRLDGSNLNLEDNDIKNQLGIIDSKHHSLGKNAKELIYTFTTDVINTQAKYMIDFSVYLSDRKEKGAVRLLFDKGFTDEAIKDKTPSRIGMNKRTTIFGDFTTEDKATWTITDGVVTGDTNNGLPYTTRELSGKQNLTGQGGVKTATYGLDDNGKMIVINNVETLSSIPEKETKPSGIQAVGNIAVYEINTDITDSEDGYSISGVNINKYEDILVREEWMLPDNNSKMPSHGLVVYDEQGKNLKEYTVSEGEEGKSKRNINLPKVKSWKFENNVLAKIKHTIKQSFPQTPGFNYFQNMNYYKSDERLYLLHNTMAKAENIVPANFTIIIKDNEGKPIKGGAKFKLLSADGNGGEALTNDEGKAAFTNVMPGNYTLVETKTSPGYKLDAKAKNIIVNNDGTIAVKGENIKITAGVGKAATEEAAHNPYKSYMNASYYGKIDENGNVEYYIYLKNKPNEGNSKTDRNTRLNLILDNGTIENVEVIDVDPVNRDYTNSQMVQQKADSIRGGNIIGDTSWGVEPITGEANKLDSFTKKSGYQLKFPKSRFENDWGFLVKVKGKVNKGQTSRASFDWLTDEESVASQAKLQKNITLGSPSDSKGETLIEIVNEKLKEQEVKVVKINKEKKALSGATFELKTKDGKVIANKVTDKNGIANFGSLASGKYILEETNAPENYLESKVYFEVEVKETGGVFYKALKKDGTEANHGIDYFLDNELIVGEIENPSITSCTQNMYLEEGRPGQTGTKPGIWEAYKFEGYNWECNISMSNVKPGSTLVIDFDPHLNFKRYVNGIPNITKNGVLIAKPNFDFQTNRLTYVFNNRVGEAANVEARIEINGIIPDQYYAVTDEIGYDFTNVVDPDGATPYKQTIHVQPDYGKYFGSFHAADISNGMRDTFKDSSGREYVTVISYYNPTVSKIKKAQILKFDWLSAQSPGPGGLTNYTAIGEPAYKLNNVKVYEVLPEWHNGKFTNAHRMPKSYGIRPGDDPYTYKKIVDQNINPYNDLNTSQNGIRIRYIPRNIKSKGTVSTRAPLEVHTPRLSYDQGYVIEHTFEITNKKRFEDNWKVFWMHAGGTAEVGQVILSHWGRAFSDQTQVEIPKFYTQNLKVVNNPYTPGQFKLVKLNEANREEKLQGAVFSLTDSKDHKIYRTTDANGEISFTNIKPGEYTLEETKAPENFNKVSKTWKISVRSTGSVTIVETGLDSSAEAIVGDNNKIALLQVTNKPVGTEFIIYKKDDKNKPLEGAKFKLTKQIATKPVCYGTSDKDGVVKFLDNEGKSVTLTEGKFILEETRAPIGYKKTNKKWVVLVDKNNKIKVHEYVDPNNPTDPNANLGLLKEKETHFVDVSKRPTKNWSSHENRWQGYAEGSAEPFKLGTRIIGINKNKKYIIQRYVINPEADNIGETIASIHREKPSYENMDWYTNSFVKKDDFKVYKLNKKITGKVEDIRFENFKITDITKDISAKKAKHDGEPDRLELTLPKTNLPIVVDVKVPYKDENGGVGTGMDLTGIDNKSYWKSDYYEKISDIVLGEEASSNSGGGNDVGAFISNDSLDVTNEPRKHEFKLKKVKENETDTITGATFRLSGPIKEGEEGPNTEDRYEKSGEDGIVSFKDLAAGHYKLVEESPAPGYDKANVDYDVIIRPNGDIYIKDNAAKPNPPTPNPGGEDPKPPTSTWQKVDIKTSGKTTWGDGNSGNRNKTHITEVDLTNKKFKQVFILNKAEMELNEPKISIHAQEEDRDVDKSISVKIETVAKTSEPENIINGDIISSKSEEWKTVNAHNRKEIILGLRGNESLGIKAKDTIAITIESPLPDSGKFGFGMDFYPDGNKQDNHGWSAERYTDKNKIKLKDGARSAIADRAANNSNFTEVPNRKLVIPEYKSVSLKNNKSSNYGSLRTGYQEIDPKISSRPRNYGDHSRVKTKITHIDKGRGVFKQIFLINVNSARLNRPGFEIHRQPEKTQLLPSDIINYKVYSVGSGSTLDYIIGPKRELRLFQNRLNPIQAKNNQLARSRGVIAARVNSPILVEIETKYPGKNEEFGLGMDFLYQGINSSNPPKYWAAQTYPSAESINPIIQWIEDTKNPVEMEIPIRDDSTDSKNDVPDSSMYEGESRIVEGKKGKKKVYYEYKYVDGNKKDEKRVSREEVIEGMIPKRKYVGTKKRPQTRHDERILTEPIIFETEYIEDKNLPEGENQEIQAGENGEAEFKYTIVYERKFGKSVERPEDWPENAPYARPEDGEIVIAYNRVLTKTLKNPVPKKIKVGKGAKPNPDGYNPPEGYKKLADGVIPKVVNIKVGLELKIHKKNTKDMPLAGAEFELKDRKIKVNENGKEIEKIDPDFKTLKGTSDENGLVVFKDESGKIVKLMEGFYTLEEVKTPQGYKKPSTKWRIEVSELSNGKMIARVDGPSKTNSEFVQDDKNVKIKLRDEEIVQNNLNTNSQIKYASKMTYIDTHSGTFKQRIYIDISGYHGKGPVNVQIVPVIKREEIDTPGKSPVTIKKGVKTAYRTTYRITNPASDLDVNSVLNSYDLSRSDVDIINTARWRPFDWGFDEDQINLTKKNPRGDKLAYFIDIEGYYDPEISNEGKIELDISFFTERNFLQYVVDKDGNIGFKKIGEYVEGYWKNKGSYQAGAAAMKLGKKKGPNDKYPGWLSKTGGKIETGDPIDNIRTIADISSLYTSGFQKEIPQEGMTIVNEEESYNITFTKLGREDPTWDNESQKLADSRLEGAVFKLQEASGTSFADIPGSFVGSAFNGYIGFRGLKPGRYRLIEVQAPKGYRPIKDPLLYMTITHKGETTDPKTGEITPGRGEITFEYDNANGVFQYRPDTVTDKHGKLVDFVTSATAKHMGKIINEKPMGKATLIKKSEDSSFLEGAKFRLVSLDKKVEKDEKEESKEFTTDKDGKILFEKLPLGHYRLEEVSPKFGYKNNGLVYNFTIGGEKIDSYSEPVAIKGKDVSEDINLQTNASFDSPYSKKEKDTLRPYKNDFLTLKNNFTVKTTTEINPGDYFTLELKNLVPYNVEDVSEEFLDIMEEGMGTIAKASYDKDKNAITYTFTEYVKTFKLLNFTNSLMAYVDGRKIKNSENAEAEIKIKGKESVKIKFKADYKIKEITSWDSYYADEEISCKKDENNKKEKRSLKNYINMTSKITDFNPQTKEFTHIIYVNREKFSSSLKPWFYYSPDKNVDNIKIEVYKLNDNSDEKLKNSMPESFAFDENDDNLTRKTSTVLGQITKDSFKMYKFKEDMNENSSFIIRIRGRVTDTDANNYSALSSLKIIKEENKQELVFANAERKDKAFFSKYSIGASNEITINAINPKAEIEIRKTDDKYKPLKGAKFALKQGIFVKEILDFSITKEEKTSGEDGLVKFENLGEGHYRIIETDPPSGYGKIEGPVLDFYVDADGLVKIKSKIPKKDMKKSLKDNGKCQDICIREELEEANLDFTSPINVINRSSIEFVKIDGDKKEKDLKNAKFNLYYKENDCDDYKVINDEKTGKPSEFTSDKDGKFTLSLSKDGYYAIKELKAPRGYRLKTGYIKEFKLEKGKIKILEKYPIRASLRIGEKDLISSKILSMKEDMEKKAKTFKARIIVNPYCKDIQLSDYKLKLEGNEITITSIKIAELEKGKPPRKLDDKDFTDFKLNNSKTINLTNINGKSCLLILEGTFKNSTNYGLKLYKGAEMADQVNIPNVNVKDDSFRQYVDYYKEIPIEVENRKAQYPLTGGTGTVIFTLAGLAVMTSAAIFYRRRRFLDE